MQIGDKHYPTDPENYLQSLSDWEPLVAETMAQADGLLLSADHWDILHCLQEYYRQYQIAPTTRVLSKLIGRKLGQQKANNQYIKSLFADGVKQACRYAGLPKPTGCA